MEIFYKIIMFYYDIVCLLVSRKLPKRLRIYSIYFLLQFLISVAIRLTWDKNFKNSEESVSKKYASCNAFGTPI